MTRLFLALSYGALVAGCAAAPKSAAGPSLPASEAAPAPAQAGYPGTPPTAADGAAVQLDLGGLEGQFAQTLADTDRLDCPNACRALGSLERSAGSICGIVGARSGTCQDVQKKRDEAKSRVRERCGACP